VWLQCEWFECSDAITRAKLSLWALYFWGWKCVLYLTNVR
jgi:hypothetical protein